MFCKFCGNKLSSNDRVCPHCGHSITEKVSVKPQKNQNQTLLVLILVTLIMALLVVALLIVYKMPKQNQGVTNAGNVPVVLQVTASPEPTATQTIAPTATPSSTQKPTPTPTRTPTPIPTLTPNHYDSFDTYVNEEYGFYCAYPTDFVPATPSGVNAVRTYVSEDSSAVMTIRAAWNTDGLTLEEAMEDLYREYGSTSRIIAHGETWYAADVTKAGGSRLMYRKLFIRDGIICCMDFDFNEEDLEIYSPCIEYIEDNFKLN